MYRSWMVFVMSSFLGLSVLAAGDSKTEGLSNQIFLKYGRFQLRVPTTALIALIGVCTAGVGRHVYHRHISRSKAPSSTNLAPKAQ